MVATLSQCQVKDQVHVDKMRCIIINLETNNAAFFSTEHNHGFFDGRGIFQLGGISPKNRWLLRARSVTRPCSKEPWQYLQRASTISRPWPWTPQVPSLKHHDKTEGQVGGIQPRLSSEEKQWSGQYKRSRLRLEALTRLGEQDSESAQEAHRQLAENQARRCQGQLHVVFIWDG